MCRKCYDVGSAVRTKGCHYKSSSFCHPVMTAGGGRSNASGALDAGEGMQCICIDEKWGFITPTRVSEHPSPFNALDMGRGFSCDCDCDCYGQYKLRRSARQTPLSGFIPPQLRIPLRLLDSFLTTQVPDGLDSYQSRSSLLITLRLACDSVPASVRSH